MKDIMSLLSFIYSNEDLEVLEQRKRNIYLTGRPWTSAHWNQMLYQALDRWGTGEPHIKSLVR